MSWLCVSVCVAKMNCYCSAAVLRKKIARQVNCSDIAFAFVVDDIQYSILFGAREKLTQTKSLPSQATFFLFLPIFFSFSVDWRKSHIKNHTLRITFAPYFLFAVWFVYECDVLFSTIVVDVFYVCRPRARVLF